MEKVKKEEYFKGDEKIFINKSIYLPFLMEHFHDFLEIVYIYSGSGIHFVNGREYKVTKGDLFFINYNVSHNFKPTSEDFSWINCLFLPEILDESLIDSKNAYDLLQAMLFKPFFEDDIDFLFNTNLLSKQKDFNSIFEDMYNEYTLKSSGYELILKSYLTILLSKIFRIASERYRADDTGKKKEIILKVLNYLEKNYSRPMKLEEVARQVLLSPNYFATIFKNTTGYSLLDYLHKIRVEEACRLLTTTNDSVNDIILEIGLSDSKFFYEIFKRHTGMTPGQYKKRSSIT